MAESFDLANNALRVTKDQLAAMLLHYGDGAFPLMAKGAVVRILFGETVPAVGAKRGRGDDEDGGTGGTMKISYKVGLIVGFAQVPNVDNARRSLRSGAAEGAVLLIRPETQLGKLAKNEQARLLAMDVIVEFGDGKEVFPIARISNEPCTSVEHSAFVLRMRKLTTTERTSHPVMTMAEEAQQVRRQIFGNVDGSGISAVASVSVGDFVNRVVAAQRRDVRAAQLTESQGAAAGNHSSVDEQYVAFLEAERKRLQGMLERNDVTLRTQMERARKEAMRAQSLADAMEEMKKKNTAAQVKVTKDHEKQKALQQEVINELSQSNSETQRQLQSLGSTVKAKLVEAGLVQEGSSVTVGDMVVALSNAKVLPKQ